MRARQIGEDLVGVGGQFRAFIPSGASTTTVKSGAGRVGRVSVTTAGTAAFTIFDSVTGSGNAVYVSSTSTSAGQVIDLSFPVETGITVVNVASGPAFAISFS